MLRPILVVEDDRKIANVVKVYLQEAGYRVIHTEKGRELPDVSGEEVCQELKEIEDFPVIMLTSKYSEEERVAGFALGADDYVVKPFSPRELVYRVKAVLRRAQKAEAGNEGPLSFNSGALLVDGQTYEVKLEGAPVKLTGTELKVLYALAASPGKVFTREELVDRALGYQFEGYERSIDAHIKNIRHKIESDPKSPAYIHTVYGVGYRFAGRRDV
jgi:two-component system OmpR family response regulator